jgi:hypothetical protein
MTDGGRWLSYSELAGERGISRQSAVRLVRRQWRRQMGNDGEARVFVPADHLPGVTPPDDATGHDPGHNTGLLAGALTALEDAVQMLREQLAGAQQQVQAANARAERAEAGRDAERARADALRERIEDLQTQLTARQEMIDAPEAAAARAERGEEAERNHAGSMRIIDELKAGQTVMEDIHARELAVAQYDADAGQQAAAELRLAGAARKARGLVARLRAAWRGE